MLSTEQHEQVVKEGRGSRFTYVWKTEGALLRFTDRILYKLKTKRSTSQKITKCFIGSGLEPNLQYLQGMPVVVSFLTCRTSQSF